MDPVVTQMLTGVAAQGPLVGLLFFVWTKSRDDLKEEKDRHDVAIGALATRNNTLVDMICKMHDDTLSVVSKNTEQYTLMKESINGIKG